MRSCMLTVLLLHRHGGYDMMLLIACATSFCNRLSALMFVALCRLGDSHENPAWLKLLSPKQTAAIFEKPFVSFLETSARPGASFCPPALCELGDWCLRRDPEERPEMYVVVHRLHSIMSQCKGAADAHGNLQATTLE